MGRSIKSYISTAKKMRVWKEDKTSSSEKVTPCIRVVDPKLLFSDPDPALGLISDPDPDSGPDPACLTKFIRLYLIYPQESIAQRFSSHFRR
jgi:hypothetical protein